MRLMKKRLVVAAALLASVSGAASATASSGPAAFKPVRHAAMAGTTTLQWTGAVGIVLDLPAGTTLHGADVELTTRGASYAFVRFVPEHDIQWCPASVGPRCASWEFSYIHSLDDSEAFASAPPAQRHSNSEEPPAIPVWRYPRLDAYLFTDGVATVTMRWDGLKGRANYKPIGHIHGRAETVPMTCVPLGCATSTGRSNGLLYGGDTYDLAGHGWVDVTSAFSTDDDNKPINNDTRNQVHGQAYCFYPNPSDPAASADPKDHPYGCGLVPTDGPDTVSSSLVAGNEAASSIPSSYTAAWTYWSGVSGRSYVGVRADGAGPNASHATAYAVWFRYGIT